MEIVDLEKLDIALTYIDRIANGNNPVNNAPADDSDVLNNPNLIRCMFFIKEILQEVKRNNGVIGGKSTKRGKAEFPFEVLKDFKYQEDTAISKIVAQINQLINEDLYKKIMVKSIIQWLVSNEYLSEVRDGETGKVTKTPTKKGMQLGIRAENRNFNGREYQAIIYNRQAQEYLVENLESIMTGEENKK